MFKFIMSVYTLAMERARIMLSKGHMVPSEEKKSSVFIVFSRHLNFTYPYTECIRSMHSSTDIS